MLRDTLLKWCQEQYEASCAGHCGLRCDNMDGCKHDCDKCLDQVHWFQEYNGRRDYNCPLLLLKYVLRFTNKYSEQIFSALQNINLSNYPEYDIFSIGCGGVPDFMAFEELPDNKFIYYKGYDRNCLWAEIHNKIEEYAEKISYADIKLRRKDIFHIFAEGKPKHHQYNVVIIQYLLSHLYNIDQNKKISALFDYIISNVLPMRLQNSPFLIIITDIDSFYKGRNLWYAFLDKLEDAGYYGNAYARSAYTDGDLGQNRWSNFDHKRLPVFGNITYNYEKNYSEHDAAQLIIELR